MKNIENFRKLDLWKEARLLTLEVYKCTEEYPKHERYGLVSQMRRASISVVANIVEGTKRKTIKDRKYFLVMSDTSLEELKCYFLLGYDIKYIDENDGKVLMEKSREVGRMLNCLRNSIKLFFKLLIAYSC